MRRPTLRPAAAPPIPQARGQNPLSASSPPQCWRPASAGVVGALDDALAADVDPRARGHLAGHHEALAVSSLKWSQFAHFGTRFEFASSTRGASHASFHADRFARLDQQRFVVVEIGQRLHDRVEAFPVARARSRCRRRRRLLRVLGDLGSGCSGSSKRRLGEPGFRGARGAARRADHAIGEARATRGARERLLIVTMHGSLRCGAPFSVLAVLASREERTGK